MRRSGSAGKIDKDEPSDRTVSANASYFPAQRAGFLECGAKIWTRAVISRDYTRYFLARATHLPSPRQTRQSANRGAVNRRGHFEPDPAVSVTIIPRFHVDESHETSSRLGQPIVSTDRRRQLLPSFPSAANHVLNNRLICSHPA